MPKDTISLGHKSTNFLVTGCEVRGRVNGEVMPTKAGKSEAAPLVLQIREAIKASGLSLNEIGRLSGVEVSRISRFVRGVRSIDVAAAADICRVLGYQLTKVKSPEPAKPAAKRKKQGAGQD